MDKIVVRLVDDNPVVIKTNENNKPAVVKTADGVIKVPGISPNHRHTSDNIDYDETSTVEDILDGILDLIPPEATTQNKLSDKQYVNNVMSHFEVLSNSDIYAIWNT